MREYDKMVFNELLVKTFLTSEKSLENKMDKVLTVSKENKSKKK